MKGIYKEGQFYIKKTVLRKDLDNTIISNWQLFEELNEPIDIYQKAFKDEPKNKNYEPSDELSESFSSPEGRSNSGNEQN